MLVGAMLFSFALFDPISFLSFFFSFQLRNAPNFLWHEHAIFIRWFSNHAQPSIGKRDGMLLFLILLGLLSYSLLGKCQLSFLILSYLQTNHVREFS
jgi:hypothetical protein